MSKDSRTYDVLMEVWNKPDPYFTISWRFGLSRYDPWRLEPDDKKQPTHVLAGTRQSLIAVFPDAIAIGSPAAQGRFTTLWGALLIAGLFGGWSFYAFCLVFTERYFDFMGAAISLLGALLSAIFFWWTFRRVFMTVSDWPIVFNRKTRQVTYLPVVIMPILKFWTSPVLQWRTASWDEVKVRTYKHLETNGGKSFHDSYDMVLLWGGEGGDPHALRECVGIGYQGYFEDELIWILWEHIRRYMEEDGPAIPPGEELRPKTLGRPVVYPPEVIEAAGGPPLDAEAVAKLAEETTPP